MAADRARDLAGYSAGVQKGEGRCGRAVKPFRLQSLTRQEVAFQGKSRDSAETSQCSSTGIDLH